MRFPRLNSLLLLTISLFNIISFTSLSEQTSYRAVIVSSYHQEFEAKRNMIQTLKADLLANTKIQTLYMDSKRVETRLLEKISQHILSFVKNYSPDIVFLCDDNALKYLGELLLLQGQQVVFLGINDNPRYYVSAELFPKLKGVLEKPLYMRGILELQPLYPSAQSITLLMDGTVTANIIKERIFNGADFIKQGGLHVNYQKVKTFQQLKRFIHEINKVPKKQLFLISLFNLTDEETGNKISSNTAVNWMKENYTKPIYSFWKEKVKDHSIFAAYGISEEQQGHAAAKIGNNTLLRKTDNLYVITPDQGTIFISEKQLNKFNLKITDDYIKRNAIFFK